MKPLRQVSPNRRYVYCFTPVYVQLRLNRYGGCFNNGRPLPEMQRRLVLDLYYDGFHHRQIGREVCSSPGFAQKVIRTDTMNKIHHLEPQELTILGQKLMKQPYWYTEVQKVRKPSIFSSEIQQKLLLDVAVHPANLPSSSQINKVIRKDLVIRWQERKLLPFHLNPPPLRQKRLNDFLTEITNINPTTLHFFDESSVIKTTGNRKYGSAPLGAQANLNITTDNSYLYFKHCEYF